MNWHALLNACLNLTCATLLVFGYRAIKRREIERHKKLMISAFTVSLIFLGSYLVRQYTQGHTSFSGTGASRYVYGVILATHVTLAMGVPVLAGRSIFLGLKDRRATHRWWATKTFPIWLYVSVTGVIVYLMLYHWPFG